MNWSNWVLVSLNNHHHMPTDKTARQLFEVETRDGQRFLLAELNHRGGGCDCCTVANWFWDQSYVSNHDIIKYRTTIVPE